MAVVSIAGFAFGIYGTMFYEKRPDATVSVESDLPVFDIHTNVSKLSVTYAGNDLRKSNQTLRLVKLRVMNTGNKDIVRQDYDENEPVGFEIKNGTIVEVPATTGSSDYLRRNLRVTTDSNKITISPLILESGEFVEFQLLVLSAPNENVAVTASGKIAGIREIKVVRSDQIEEAQSVWKRATSADNWRIQFVRGPIYLIVFLGELLLLTLASLLLFAPIGSFRDYRTRRKRRASLSDYVSGRVLSRCEKTVVETYYRQGKFGLAHLVQLIERIAKRNDLVSKLQPIFAEQEISRLLRAELHIHTFLLDEYKRLGLVTEDGLKIIVDDELPKVLSNVCEVLQYSLEDLKKSSN
jgi:hypothetical protein